MTQQTQCGYIAIVGRPNVGKSTLLNHLLQQKISITSRKPQTTRHNITGIKTVGPVQMIFVDTPGLHQRQNSAINRYMNRVAASAIDDVDVILFVVDRDKWTPEDQAILERLRPAAERVVVVVNKVDRVHTQESLIAQLERLQTHLEPAAILPTSALKKQNLDHLEKAIVARLPAGEHLYEADQVTDRSTRFLAAEMIREKIMRQLGAEIPYQINVEIEEYREEQRPQKNSKGRRPERENNSDTPGKSETIVHIGALILVEREGQKRIVIGDKGERLKSIGKAAREDIEIMVDARVMLRLWVKVKAGWSDDDRALRSLGYDS